LQRRNGQFTAAVAAFWQTVAQRARILGSRRPLQAIVQQFQLTKNSLIKTVR
jgi:hypothetical protein